MEAAAMPAAGTPERSVQQRMEALKEANRVRRVRAHLKREVKRHERDPRTMLEHPDCQTMKLVDCLQVIPGVGLSKINGLLRAQMISPGKTIGGLSRRQLEAVTRFMDR